MTDLDFDDLAEWIEPFTPSALPVQILMSTALVFFGMAMGMVIGG